MIDLHRWGLDTWMDPRDAAHASIAESQALLAALVALRLDLQNQLFCCERAKRRDLERALDDTYKSATMLMSLLRTERDIAR